MVDPGFYFDGPRFFLEILVDPGLVDPGSEKLSFTLLAMVGAAVESFISEHK